MQIHDRCRVRDLTPTQITSLTAFLSSPSTAPDAPNYPVAHSQFAPPSPNEPPLPTIKQKLANAAPRAASSSTSASSAPTPPVPGLSKPNNKNGRSSGDPLKNLKIETDLRREIRENIAHHKMIGSYVGRRHAMGLPVRGQNTQTNAKTARKLNRVERYN
ncbi:hypothetical protein NLI96_g11274 [Meripilus lineatus]|uniref:Small ribosomal subunit protein uS13m n=1 Tax=Meripilus lineatus TaxID=2056292 RepID=A0AAD5Y8K1_9APHY|nr:hypothetical protein NLI96_g11274 [Physisporinus lineatus]